METAPSSASDPSHPRTPAAWRRRALLVGLALLLAGGLGACGGDGQGGASGAAPGGTTAGGVDDGDPRPPFARGVVDQVDPPTARTAMVEDLRRAQAVVHGPADGQGRAWVEGYGALLPDGFAEGVPPMARGAGRWTFVFEAGPEGVAVGGAVLLQVSPFWQWSQPWCLPEGEVSADLRDGRPGLSEVHTDAEGVELQVSAVELGVFVTVGGRALAAGEQLVFVYGAGRAGARADLYAERSTPFWFSVDGDGDGQLAFLTEPVRLDVAPGPPARLVAHLTSSLRPGQEGALDLAVLDAFGNRGPDFDGELRLVDGAAELGLPDRVAFTAGDGATRRLTFTPPAEGVFRLVVEGPGELLALSNPLVVSEVAEPVAWGDLHGHTHVSDGTGTPEDYFRYARDVAALDVVSLTDHDHWGFRKLDADPETFQLIKDQVEAFHEPGRFVTLAGYEWTNWIHGHRHVVGFGPPDEFELLSSMDPAYETPRQLWDALRGRPVMTIAHHSAGEPIPVNWTYRPDPELEPVTEIVSVHGSSEAADSPRVLRGARPGNFVRDVLDSGVRFGFIGSGDSHDGHPGMPHLMNPTGGLAALFVEELSREGVRATLTARRCYATSGPRILLRTALAGHRMGSSLPAPHGPADLRVLVHGVGPLLALDVVRSGQLVLSERLDGELTFDHVQVVPLEGLEAGEYVYVRVIQRDGHMAWSSPFYVE